MSVYMIPDYFRGLSCFFYTTRRQYWLVRAQTWRAPIIFVSTQFLYRISWCSPHRPRYTVLTGSTARAVATRSSALCLRPLTMSSPSIFPTTKIRLPYEKQGVRDTSEPLRQRDQDALQEELKLPQMLCFNRKILLTGPTNPKSPDRTNGISPMGTPFALTGITWTQEKCKRRKMISCLHETVSKHEQGPV